MADAKDIKSETLLTITRTQNEEQTRGSSLRVVSWIVGEKHYPQLEKREFFKNKETGEWLTGKSKGLNGSDILAVLKKLPEILRHLKVDPKLANEAFQEGIESAKQPVTTSANEDF